MTAVPSGSHPTRFPGARGMILATRGALLPPRFQGPGFVALEGGEIVSGLQEAGLWIGPRVDLEDMPTFRQIIPYIILQVGDRLIRYVRTPAGSEARLHGRMSIGLGGHVDLSDIVADGGDAVDLDATLAATAAREIREEVGAVEIVSRTWIGVVFDDRSEVSRVHIGIVGLWRLGALPPTAADAPIGDPSIGNLALISLAALEQAPERLEDWSALVVRHLRRDADRLNL